MVLELEGKKNKKLYKYVQDPLKKTVSLSLISGRGVFQHLCSPGWDKC